ncbi:hypothetical protein ACOBV8_21485 (plasmid) [Pseudoalteromonas espejiana]
MRGFYYLLIYSSYIGSVGDGLLGLYAVWVLISNNLALLSLSLNDFLAQYVEFIYWVKTGCFYVMPQALLIGYLWHFLQLFTFPYGY